MDPAAPASVFDRAFAAVIGVEGGLSLDPEDPGNWTGGAAGQGRLAGTKFGVSAASFPTLDIGGLTLDGAKAIYRKMYWSRVAGDALPPAVAVLAFDCAVNQGPGVAALILQQAAGAAADGVIGPATLRAVAARPAGALFTEMLARRSLRYATSVQLDRYGLGWFRRLASIAVAALAPG